MKKTGTLTGRSLAHDMVLISAFTAMIAVSAWITIPVLTIQFTMQLFAIFLALGTLGGRRGTVCVALYLVLGAVGLPVFSSFNAGIGALLGVTGGYLVGFFPMALVYWGLRTVVKKQGMWVEILLMVSSLIVCYAFGTAWFIVLYTKNKGAIGVWSALCTCVFPYVIPDLVKIVLANRLSALIRRNRWLRE